MSTSMRGVFSRNLSPARPASPTFSETTNISAMNFGSDGPEKIITRANLRASLQAYEELMNTCASYRMALINMSKATAAFADAMSACSSLKGPTYEAGTRLQASSGLHHLIGNHYAVLAVELDKNFEKPLRQHLDTYKTIVTERSATYERALKEKSQIIHETETRNMKKRERNLQSFREVLAVLQRQVDELDALKATHYQEIVDHEEEVWDVVQNKICLVVRSTMEIFDRFTTKAVDPVIEPMLQAIPDPFDSYGPPPAEDQIFSILNPLSISSGPSSLPSPITVTSELDDGFGSSSWHASGFNGSHRDVPSPTTPRSLSPPQALSRQHSFLTSPPTHHSRHSESKLRSVVSADENLGGPPIVNGGTLKAPKPQKPPTITSFSWSSDKDDREQETPRLSQYSNSPFTSPAPETETKQQEPVSIPVAS